MLNLDGTCLSDHRSKILIFESKWIQVRDITQNPMSKMEISATDGINDGELETRKIVTALIKLSHLLQVNKIFCS